MDEKKLLMPKFTNSLRVLLLSFALVACGPLPTQDGMGQIPPQDHKPEDNWAKGFESNGQQGDGQTAVVALLDRADQKAKTGNMADAAAIIERALRISPRNGDLWHRLAKIRLQQNRSLQAIHLALKSNSLVKDDSTKAANWRVIYEARQQSGDVDGSLKALEMAKRLEGELD